MTEILIKFDRSTQGISALREAAYRIVREASCQIDAAGVGYLCRLTPKPGLGPTGGEGLRARFLDLVTDENLREQVAAQTSGVRDVILALAFGALVTVQQDAEPA
jgi:His-Xaa-Ser system protein HxsD